MESEKVEIDSGPLSGDLLHLDIGSLQFLK